MTPDWFLRVRGWASSALNRGTARPPGDPRHLLVDVSVICRHDAGTGIQRVVRSFWAQLCLLAPDDLKPVPVFANGWRGFCYASADFLEQTEPSYAGSERVVPRAGDVFFGLDLSTRALPRNRRQIRAWKAAGVTIHVMVYDLLPVNQQNWFPYKLVRRFRRWLDFVATHADQAVCISSHVADELVIWLRTNFPAEIGRLKISKVPLGGDIAQSIPTVGLPSDIDVVIEHMRNARTILMVGTIEPRKGYDQVLDAFDLIWDDPSIDPPSLFIAGRPGWMTDDLQHRLKTHSQFDKRLRWFPEASDELIDCLYRECTAVLTASRAEGYGLPLAEALAHQKPVLARDLPVFRELEAAGLQFFTSEDAKGLAKEIRAFIDQGLGEISFQPGIIPTWPECTGILLERLDAVANRAEQAGGSGKP